MSDTPTDRMTPYEAKLSKYLGGCGFWTKEAVKNVGVAGLALGLGAIGRYGVVADDRTALRVALYGIALGSWLVGCRPTMQHTRREYDLSMARAAEVEMPTMRAMLEKFAVRNKYLRMGAGLFISYNIGTVMLAGGYNLYAAMTE